MSTTPVDFVHLHVHSEFSLLDGACRIKDILARAAELGMPALAITDHGNMFGVADFYKHAAPAGVKPILGFEAYVAPHSRFDRSPSTDGQPERGYHLTLLARNITGYRNLLELTSAGYLEGMYYNPRIDKALLQEKHEGIIALSGCLAGEIPYCLRAGQRERALQAGRFYRDLFGPENFFIELQDTGEADQKRIMPQMADLARELELGLVATNDIHYLMKEDSLAQDVLVCINTGKLLSDTKRMKFQPHYYLKTGREMANLFADYPQSIANTVRIAERCEIKLDMKTRHCPVFRSETGETGEQMLRRLCEEGVVRRFGRMTPELKERLDHELSVIISKGFADYILIVYDFVRFCKANDIPCGARGSGVSTLVGYSLEISKVDPIKYDLLFERFMDPERNEMPDFDIDICQEGRPKVIEYVRSKYGADHVAQIITFGTLGARAAIRDVGRVLDVPLAEVNAIAKKVPEELKITIAGALEKEPELKKMYDGSDRIRQVFDIAMRLEGLARNMSVHAAGVVIADAPLVQYVPLAKSGDDVVTQWPGSVLDDGLLLKMDFLGLRTLTTLHRAVQLVREVHGVQLELEKLDPTDALTFRLFSEGHTSGIFQFESDGMRRVLQQMGPESIFDLTAANALYRPGPMAMIPDYVKRKHGEPWSVPHPMMEEVLRETYGIMVYQEQVMRTVNRLGKIPLGRAYKLIKAISKKKQEVINAEKEHFIKGCGENGVSRKEAEGIFEQIEVFAGYGFNKSHSAGYAHVAFQAGYLKAHYPVEYMAALLTFESSNTDKVAQYIKECRDMGIAVLPPDVNESDVDFTVVGKSIRFGLGAVKGVGTKAVEAILETRRAEKGFHSLGHLCSTVDLRTCNKTVLESLNSCGALDSLPGRRSQKAAVIEDALRLGAQKQVDRRHGQSGLFDGGGGGGKEEDLKLPEIAEWSDKQMLAHEKATLGFYVSNHPMNFHDLVVRKLATCDIAGLQGRTEGRPVTLAVLIASVRRLITRNDQPMAVMTLEDASGECDAVVFPDAYEKVSTLLEPDSIVVVRGEVNVRDERAGVQVAEVIPIEQAWSALAQGVRLTVDATLASNGLGGRLKALLESSVGKAPVLIDVRLESGVVVSVQTRKPSGVALDGPLMTALAELVGAEALDVRVRPPAPTRQRRGGGDRYGGGR